MSRSLCSLGFALFSLSFSVLAAVVPDYSVTSPETAHELGLSCARWLKSVRGFETSPDSIHHEANRAVREAFSTCLSHYVRIKTLNELENETLAAAFLKTIFDELHIPSQTFLVPDRTRPGHTRAVLVATLTPENARSGGEDGRAYDWTKPGRPSLVLLNHMDVVSADPTKWQPGIQPFGGQIAVSPKDREVHVWGRGAVDMKGLALLQLFSMAFLQQNRYLIERDIHFLAVGDEENRSSGALGALAEMRVGGKLAALSGAQVALGEGGMGVHGVIGQHTTVHLVASEEKGGAWLKLQAKDARALLAALSKLGLFPTVSESHSWFSFGSRKSIPWRCSLTEAASDSSEVNVVSRKVSLGVLCEETFPSLAYAKKLFSEGAPGIEVETVYEGNLLRVTLSAAASEHGALAKSVSVLQAAGQGLQRLKVFAAPDTKLPSFYDYKKTWASQQMLNTIGADYTAGEILDSGYYYLPKLGNLGDVFPSSALGAVGRALYSEGLFRTTCAWSGLHSEAGQLEALVDCRLIQPTTGKNFLWLARKIVDDLPVQVTAQESWDFTQSPTKYFAFEVLKQELESEAQGKAVVAVSPFLALNGSDLSHFRMRGIPSYGFFPAVLPMDIISSQHGVDERFPIPAMVEAVRRYYRVVLGMGAWENR